MRRNSLTIHSFGRIGERMEVENPYYRNCTAQIAFDHGKRYTDVKRMNLSLYLWNRTNEAKQAVAYGGQCFIFSKTNDSCITVFPIPKRIVSSQKGSYRKGPSAKTCNSYGRTRKANAKKYLRYLPPEERDAA